MNPGASPRTPTITLADGTTDDDGRAVRARRARTSKCSPSTSTSRLVPGTMTHVFESGVKQVFELRLASGRCVTASANHPFLTLDGWVHLGDARVRGARIASTRPAAAGVDPRHDTIPREVWDYIERKGLLVDGACARHDLIERLGADEGGVTACTSTACRVRSMRRIADELPDAFLADLGVQRRAVGRDRRDRAARRGAGVRRDGRRARTTSSPTTSSCTTASNRTPTSCCSSTATSTTTRTPTSAAWRRSSCRSTATARPGRPRLAFRDQFTQFANLARE